MFTTYLHETALSSWLEHAQIYPDHIKPPVRSLSHGFKLHNTQIQEERGANNTARNSLNKRKTEGF